MRIYLRMFGFLALFKGNDKKKKLRESCLFLSLSLSSKQISSGFLNLTLSLLRDCRLHLEEYHKSAYYIGTATSTAAFLVTILNLIISAFDPTILRYVDIDY